MDILSLLVGAVIALVSTIFTNYHKSKLDREIKTREIKKQKCEDAFTYANSNFTNYMKSPNFWDTNDYSGAKLNMVVRFYLPSIQKETNEYNKALSDYFNMRLDKSNDANIVDNFMNKYKILADAIVKESKKYDLI